MTRHAAAITLAAALLTGCAGKLIIYDPEGKAMLGVPVKSTQLFVKQGTRVAHTKGIACTHVRFQEAVSLPSGPMYYVAVDTAYLAKTSLHVKMTDQGLASEISLDSEPSGADTLRAIGDLYKAITPVVAAAASTTASIQSRGNEAAPACDSGENQVTFMTFEEYRAKHPTP